MLSADSEQYVSGISVLNGFVKYSTGYKYWLYYRNNRPKDITISFSDGTSIETTLQDIFDQDNYHYQRIDFDSVKFTAYIKITVNSVYPGDKWNDTCISEIQVY